MSDQRKEVEVTIKVQHDGYGADITASCTVDQIPGLIRRLQEHGITPANSPYVWDQQPAASTPDPVGTSITGQRLICPIHQRPLKPSKHKPGEWYCTWRLGEDPVTGQSEYCQHKVQI